MVNVVGEQVEDFRKDKEEELEIVSDDPKGEHTFRKVFSNRINLI